MFIGGLLYRKVRWTSKHTPLCRFVFSRRPGTHTTSTWTLTPFCRIQLTPYRGGGPEGGRRPLPGAAAAGLFDTAWALSLRAAIIFSCFTRTSSSCILSTPNLMFSFEASLTIGFSKKYSAVSASIADQRFAGLWARRLSMRSFACSVIHDGCFNLFLSSSRTLRGSGCSPGCGS